MTLSGVIIPQMLGESGRRCPGPTGPPQISPAVLYVPVTNTLYSVLRMLESARCSYCSNHLILRRTVRRQKRPGVNAYVIVVLMYGELVMPTLQTRRDCAGAEL